MLVTAHQPAYMPWLGYFNKMFLADIFVVLDEVQFEKNSFVNRNRIASKNGPIWLTIPTIKKGHINSTIRDLKIDSSSKWKKKHMQSIRLTYAKSPFFQKYEGALEKYYEKHYEFLFDALDENLRMFLEILKIDVEVKYLSDMDIVSKKNELIVDICKKCNGNDFLFGAEGKNYADINLFSKRNMTVYYQDYKINEYPQFNQESFISHMSILDMIFNIPDSEFDSCINSKNVKGIIMEV